MRTNQRILTLVPIAMILAGTLAACGDSNGGSGGGGAYGGGDSSSSAKSTPDKSTAAGASTGADLSTADSSLGTIVVDGKGMTAYYFTKDTKDSGVSACSGDCATAWPAIETTSDTPTVDGVTGTVGTIPAADGGKQITIDGMPIYTFAKDTAPGDVNGQDANGVWYVIAPDGTMIDG